MTALLTIGAAASALIAVLGLGRLLGVQTMWKQLRHFLTDWLGEEARPGHTAVPSMPERIVSLEDKHDVLYERVRSSDHALRSDLASRLGEIQAAMHTRGAESLEALRRLERLDNRVSDHRRRNEEQIGLLQAAVNDLIARSDRTDSQLARMEEQATHRRAEDTEPPEPATPPRYDQQTDEGREG